MIKHRVFRFEKFTSENYWVDFVHFGQMLETSEEYFDNYRECTIRLNPELAYQMSFDQSSSNTGIFIKDYTNTEVHMIEVLRNRNQDASDYIWDLEMFLHEMCKGCTFTHLIYERPINTESFRSAQVLFQLEGVIRSLGRRYPEFRNAKTDHIENASWRSAFIDKDLEHVYGRKELSRISANHLLPWTQEYGPSVYKDNDIFEAIGVMLGWFYVSFDPLGRPYVRGDRSTRPIGGFILPGLPAAEVVSMLKEHGIETQMYVENPRYAIYENLAAMAKQYTTACIEFTSKYAMLCLCVECNMKWLDPEVMTVIVVDAATLDSRLSEITGGTFHFIL